MRTQNSAKWHSRTTSLLRIGPTQKCMIQYIQEMLLGVGRRGAWAISRLACSLSHFYTNFEHLQDWVGFEIGKVVGEGIRIIDDYGVEKLYGTDGKGLEGMVWVG